MSLGVAEAHRAAAGQQPLGTDRESIADFREKLDAGRVPAEIAAGGLRICVRQLGEGSIRAISDGVA
jgi:hypothetical protein